MASGDDELEAFNRCLAKFATCVKVLPGTKIAVRGSVLRKLVREDPATSARLAMHMCTLAQTDNPAIIQNAWFIAKAHLDEFEDSTGMEYVLKKSKELGADDWLVDIDQRIT